MEIFTSIQRKAEWRCLILLSLFIQFNLQAQSIPIYATTISSQDNVDFSSNAVDGNLSTRARIRASSGVLVGIGAYSGHLELQYPGVVPANTTSFVKINTDDDLLPSLLGGSLGNLLSGVLGTGSSAIRNLPSKPKMVTCKSYKVRAKLPMIFLHQDCESWSTQPMNIS